MCVGTLTFTSPVSRSQADVALVAFVRDFHDRTGEFLDAFALDADVSDGIHCQVLWAGHSLTKTDQAIVEGLWPHGLIPLSRVRGGTASEEADLRAWGRMMEGD